MRSSGAPDHRGLRHEAALYNSEDELLSVAVPFLTGGAEAGEPTIAVFGEKNAELIHAALGDTVNISFLDATAHYSRPATTIKTYRKLLAQYVAEGAQQIRVTGEIPRAGTGLPWEWWARYEATANHAYEDFPLWVICAYDTRTTPARVLTDVTRTHPHLVTADGERVANDRFEDPAAFLTRSPASGADPLEATPPMINLPHPTPADARRAVRAASQASLLDHAEVADMVYAVNEAVTNAIHHGRPPVHLRIWPRLDHMVATVTDRGHGPPDPYAGLLPPTPASPAGVGMWLIHQTCSHVTLGTDHEGFTIRLTAGVPDLTA
jgi:anti-sigma regulatory factor (Ser/Thr protein kinase)